MLQQLKSGFKRVISWNKYLSKPELLAQNPNLNHLVKPSFQGVIFHFVSISILFSKTFPLKYLSNFWRTLEMPLINCEVNLILTWSSTCVITNFTGVGTFKKQNYMFL